MKRVHPIIAIILGFLVSVFLGYFVAYFPISTILSYLSLILGGFTANYLSKTNKAIFGLYEGLVISIVILLPSIFISNNITYFSIYNIVITPILGLLGGYISKILRSSL